MTVQVQESKPETCSHHSVCGIDVTPGFSEKHKILLPPKLLSIIAELHRNFNPDRINLLESRKARQAEFDSGQLPDYLDKESQMVTSNWTVAPIPKDLQCRRVEITGPVNSTKMVINMLSRNNMGNRADCAMLDFEDAMKPSWKNVLDGIANVIGAANGKLSHVEQSEGKEKHYQLNPNDMATLMVRVRGLHLDETHVKVDGTPVSAGLFDLAVNAFHMAAPLMKRGKTPKFYVPKMEHYLEARWWDGVFTKIEMEMGLGRSSLRATFLIETLPAAFQVEEILYELRDHAVGLNVGRWDKIFSDIKTLKAHPDRVMADRSSIGMNRDWMRNYARRLIHICHKRGAFALGGMAAFTPGKDSKTVEEQTAKVIKDKELEASWGHDGCWVSHPYFIGCAQQAFKRKNQMDVIPDPELKYPDLLPLSEGPKTLQGLRTNIRVGIAYMMGWLDDIGCVAWDNLMEDLATLEISRAQIWQWLHHKVVLDSGEPVNRNLVEIVFEEELSNILNETGNKRSIDWRKAADVAQKLFLEEHFSDFLSESPNVP